MSEKLKICLPLLHLFCFVPIHYWSSVNGKTSEANYPIDVYLYSPLYYDLHLAFQGVSQSHYFQTERTSLPPALGLHQRMMRLRVEKMTPAMEVGKTLRRRKMSEEVMLPARHFKTKMKLHKKCLSRVNFQLRKLWISIYNVSCVELLPYFTFFALSSPGETLIHKFGKNLPH